ncbi:c-type cytochrome [Granulosicoccus sp. 3-233]|uniref:c-type cytochrome n=1 Tax=Granulosicoccus sp. 3-233 TaxID=3417969 RepID=UPI003D349C7A
MTARVLTRVAALLVLAVVVGYWVVATGLHSERVASLDLSSLTGDTREGEYVAHTAGCVACHTDASNGGSFLAGGVAFNTPFGTLYSPNITSDSRTGIGDWSLTEFATAMLAGVSPEGEHYYPAFPYTSYSVMSDQELVDLKAWLDTVEPVSQVTPRHDLVWPLSNRSSMLGWKALFFDPDREIQTTDRGGYLVNGPGHCAECHASRNRLGGVADRALVGNLRGPDGQSVPGITASDLRNWTQEDMELFLEVGILPDGDFSGGHMTDVIEYSTGLLTLEDRQAIARYLLSGANGS